MANNVQDEWTVGQHAKSTLRRDKFRRAADAFYIEQPLASAAARNRTKIDDEATREGHALSSQRRSRLTPLRNTHGSPEAFLQAEASSGRVNRLERGRESKRGERKMVTATIGRESARCSAVTR